MSYTPCEDIMSGRVKIKSKVVKATLANKDVIEMFQGVLGSSSEGGSSLAIVHAKYLLIQTHVDRFIRLLNSLHDSKLMALFQIPNEYLSSYITTLTRQFVISFRAPDLSQWLMPSVSVGIESFINDADDYTKIPPIVVTQFNEAYTAIKKCNVVNTTIITCKNLVIYKKSIGNKDDLKDHFLTKSSGLSFAPLPELGQVNFKQIYNDERLTSNDQEFILLVLNKLYTIGHDVYEAISSPDVDVAEFVKVIMSSISEVKKHIPRCDQAFQKIIESVDLLKGNFKSYYKDFASSGNPTIIMENFVLDVSKNTKSTPAVTNQFRHIISHYRKLAAQQTSHPKLQTLFDQVDANFQELEKRSKEADNKNSSDEDYSDVEEIEIPSGVVKKPAAVAAASPAKIARNRRKKANAKKKNAATSNPTTDLLTKTLDMLKLINLDKDVPDTQGSSDPPAANAQESSDPPAANAQGSSDPPAANAQGSSDPPAANAQGSSDPPGPALEST